MRRVYVNMEIRGMSQVDTFLINCCSLKHLSIVYTIRGEGVNNRIPGGMRFRNEIILDFLLDIECHNLK